MPKEELTDSLSELIEFLSNYKEKNNVNNFIGILEEMQFILQSIGKPQIPAETMNQLQKMYKSMFFPRDGLSSFYILDSDATYMTKCNTQFSSLLKRIDALLEEGGS